MATYYVQPNGSDSNTGLGATNALAWRTVQKALSVSGIGSGDTLYIAPGTYREAITIAGTYSATTTIIGDRTSSQFSSVPAGYVRITGLVSDALGSSTTVGNFTTNGKSYLTFDSLWLEHRLILSPSTTNITFVRCQITTPYQPVPTNGAVIELNNTGHSAILFDKCYIQGGMYIQGSGVNTTTRFNACLMQCANNGSGGYEFVNSGACAMIFSNCTIFGAGGGQIFRGYGPSSLTASIYNCLIVPDYYSSATFGAGTTAIFIEDYNAGYITRGTVLAGLNSKQLYHRAFTHTPIYINPIDASIIPYTPLAADSLIGAGSATYSFGTDYFGNAWASPPSIGAMELKTYSTIGSYLPSERNASTITIAPGSTSQSIELYLGVTGLTASSSGLSARYNRTRTASVSIPLVARTIAQAWTSGGFAEVDATNMPGVYRLDVPDAALAAGADDVTIVVRGASGTNGAVMTVKLSSGGLTSAQTASAVWGASPAGYNDATTFGGVVNQIDQTVTGTSVLVQDVPSNVWQEQTDDHTTHGTFGYNILRADAPSKEGLVTLHQSGGISRVDADIHAIVNDTAAAAELKGALLHTGGDYISADLLTPVTSAQTVRIGPFAVRTDAGGADGALDLNQSTAGAVVVQLTDAQGTGIDQTSATVQAKVYNVAGGLVATYTCTPAYAVNGFVSIPMTTAVTGTAGSYIINLWSTVGATVIIYGPLQLRVRAI